MRGAWSGIASASFPTRISSNYSVAKKRMLAGLDPSGRRTVEYFVTEEGYQAVAYVLLQVTRAQRPGEPEGVESRRVRRSRP